MINNIEKKHTVEADSAFYYRLCCRVVCYILCSFPDFDFLSECTWMLAEFALVPSACCLQIHFLFHRPACHQSSFPSSPFLSFPLLTASLACTLLLSVPSTPLFYLFSRPAPSGQTAVNARSIICSVVAFNSIQFNSPLPLHSVHALQLPVLSSSSDAIH